MNHAWGFAFVAALLAAGCHSVTRSTPANGGAESATDPCIVRGRFVNPSSEPAYLFQSPDDDDIAFSIDLADVEILDPEPGHRWRVIVNAVDHRAAQGVSAEGWMDASSLRVVAAKKRSVVDGLVWLPAAQPLTLEPGSLRSSRRVRWQDTFDLTTEIACVDLSVAHDREGCHAYEPPIGARSADAVGKEIRLAGHAGGPPLTTLRCAREPCRLFTHETSGDHVHVVGDGIDGWTTANHLRLSADPTMRSSSCGAWPDRKDPCPDGDDSDGCPGRITFREAQVIRRTPVRLGPKETLPPVAFVEAGAHVRVDDSQAWARIDLPGLTPPAGRAFFIPMATVIRRVH